MSLRHAILGLLAIKPATGYELTQRFDLSLSHAWHASHSQVYPELAKLETVGFAEVLAEGPRRSRTWGITDAGRTELRHWLVETEVHRGQRNESGVRWFLFQLLDPVDRRAVIEREIAYVEQSRAMLDALIADKDAKHAAEPSPLAPSIDLGQRINDAMLGWLRDQLADLDDEQAG